MKTQFESFCSRRLCDGCKRCLKGEKMVLFITGICPRDCKYCPLSEKRKNVDKVMANERECKSIKDAIEEVKLSNAKGCGITGGDPLIKLERTIKYARELKKEFGKKFHIHIYLSTRLVNEKNLKKISEVVDEVRFHPEWEKDLDEEIEKISLAKKFFDKKNIGIEIPLLPEKEIETFSLLKKAIPLVGFINLNELEIGDTNFDWIQKNYKMNKDTYTIKGSLELGKKVLKKFGKLVNIHLCSARTKNWYQFKNRLNNYNTLKFSKKTNEGTVIYFSTKDKIIKKLLNKENYYLDKQKKQFIINPKFLKKLEEKIKVLRIEEYPSFDRDIVEEEERW
jgi:hypothetical protein